MNRECDRIRPVARIEPPWRLYLPVVLRLCPLRRKVFMIQRSILWLEQVSLLIKESVGKMVWLCGVT